MFYMNELNALLDKISNDDFKNADGVLLTNDSRWHDLRRRIETGVTLEASNERARSIMADAERA